MFFFLINIRILELLEMREHL